jgi:hypothetical protein
MACQPGWTLTGTTCVPPTFSSTVLVTGGTAIANLALDTNDVYWTDSSAGTVEAIPKVGGTVLTLAQGQYAPLGIAVDDTYVYWGNNLGGAIMRTPKDGSGTPSIFVVVTSPSELTVAGGGLYWLQNGAIEMTPTADGGTGTPINSWASDGGYQANSLASNGRYLAVVVQDVIYRYSNFDIIDPASVTTVAQTPLAQSFSVVSTAIDPTDYYYATGQMCPGIAWGDAPGPVELVM